MARFYSTGMIKMKAGLQQADKKHKSCWVNLAGYRYKCGSYSGQFDLLEETKPVAVFLKMIHQTGVSTNIVLTGNNLPEYGVRSS